MDDYRYYQYTAINEASRERFIYFYKGDIFLQFTACPQILGEHIPLKPLCYLSSSLIWSQIIYNHTSDKFLFFQTLFQSNFLISWGLSL